MSNKCICEEWFTMKGKGGPSTWRFCPWCGRALNDPPPPIEKDLIPVFNPFRDYLEAARQSNNSKPSTIRWLELQTIAWNGGYRYAKEEEARKQAPETQKGIQP